MICKYVDDCELYLSGRCLNGGIETMGPLKVEERLECKMIDIKKSAHNSGIFITNATEEVLKYAMIMESKNENCYLIINKK